MLDFRNVNTLYTSIISETLSRLGLTTAIICPGSRSAPLAIAFACHQGIETIPVLDERSAAFFALGMAKSTHKPVVLICTSGTAVANFFPAIIEAKESKIPLLILSADRPPELRHCHAGQTIDQVKIFGNYPNWDAELVTPSLVVKELESLRNTIIHAYKTTLLPTPGVVHLNIPFREPLVPISQPATELLRTIINPQTFFTNCQQFFPSNQRSSYPEVIQQGQDYLKNNIKNNTKGVIIAGLAQPENAQDAENYCRSIAILSQALKFPVLGESLSPIRNYASLNPYLISTYDIFLRAQELAAELTPEVVIQIGELPTSKQLRQWLEKTAAPRWIVTPDYDNFDPLHGTSQHLLISIHGLVSNLEILPPNQPSSYLDLWLNLEQKTRKNIDITMEAIAGLREPKIAWLISQILPPQTPVFIANSMPIRDVESFWKPSDRQTQIYYSRGANGIDGTLSTALGVAHNHQSSVLLTGDLALLHDTNGFLITKNLRGHLTIILINNHGGGIFENLPISKFEPPFEEYFATPQSVDFAKLAETYGIEYQLVTSWLQLQNLLQVLPTQGVRVLEIPTDRQQDAQWRRNTVLF